MRATGPTNVHLLAAFACLLALTAPCSSAPAPSLVPAEHFVSQDTYRDPVLSPDGKHLAVTTTMPQFLGTVPTLAIIRLQDKKIITAIRMGRFEVPSKHWWVSNTRLVVTKARDFGDQERPTPTGEVLTVNLDGGGQDYLYGRLRGKAADKGYAMVSGIHASLNGHFYLTEFDFERKQSALYDVDSIANERTALLRLPFAGLEMLLDHQARPRFATGYTDDARVIDLKFDVNTLMWEPNRSSTREKRVVPQAFSNDDSAVYALVSEADKPTYLVRQDVDSDAITLIASDPVFNVELVNAAPNSAEPFGWMLQGGVPRLHYLHPNSALAQLHQRLSLQFPGSLVTLLNASSDNKKLLFRVTSDREPGAYYLYDAATDGASLLLAEFETLDRDLLGERKPISFTARDGMALHGFVTLPQARPPGPLPLVLLPHGGPHGISDAWSFDDDAQFLASRGYAVLQVNYRGSGGRGEHFIKAGYEQWGGKIQDDLADGVRWAIAEGIADKDRMCVFGISFGAYSAMMLPVREPQMFRCAVGYAGVYDLDLLMRDEHHKDPKITDRVLRLYLGKNPANYRPNSPVFLADKIKLPVLLIHGSADDITPVAHGKAMRKALSDADNKPEYMQVSSEGHGFYLPANRLKVLKSLESFLARHIGPVSTAISKPPGPSLAGQCRQLAAGPLKVRDKLVKCVKQGLEGKPVAVQLAQRIAACLQRRQLVGRVRFADQVAGGRHLRQRQPGQCLQQGVLIQHFAALAPRSVQHHQAQCCRVGQQRRSEPRRRRHAQRLIARRVRVQQQRYFAVAVQHCMQGNRIERFPRRQRRPGHAQVQQACTALGIGRFHRMLQNEQAGQASDGRDPAANAGAKRPGATWTVGS